MLTFRDLGRGLRLYDDVSALYGPFYYLTVGSVFTGLHVPLTHDVARIVSTVFRLACSGMLAALTFRLCGSVLGSLFTFGACTVLLLYFPHSPLHPQEICLLMAASLPHLVLSVEQRPGRAAGPLALIGAILAGLLLTKINIGAFAGLALALVAAPARHAWRGLGAVLAGAGMLLPLALMLPLFRLGWAVQYWVFATATVGAALTAWVGGEREGSPTRQQWTAALAAAACTAAATLAATFGLGSTPYAVLDAVVLQNGRLVRNWCLPLSFPPWALGLAVAALAAAGCLRVAFRRGPARELARLAAAWLKLAAGGGGVVLIAFMAAGVQPSSTPLATLFQCLMPVSFLLLVPGAGRAAVGAGRGCLGLLTAFMVLYAFPVAGSQLAVAAVLMVCALPVLLTEGAAELRALRPGRLSQALQPSARARALASLLGLVVLAQLTAQAWRDWSGGRAAELPGAALIHLTQDEWSRTHWVLQRVASCPALYTFSGSMSFYFWTDRPSPTAINSNDALGLLSASQQERVVSDLARQPGLCIVSTPGQLKLFDRGQIASRPPLLRYIEDNFETIAENGPYAILGRKDAR